MQLTYSDLSAHRKQSLLLAALDEALRALAAPVPTKELTPLVIAAMGVEVAGPSDVSKISSDLARLAHSVPEAYRTGETFTLYGRTNYRIAWRPRGGKVLSGQETRVPAAARSPAVAAEPKPAPTLRTRQDALVRKAEERVGKLNATEASKLREALRRGEDEAGREATPAEQELLIKHYVGASERRTIDDLL